MPDTCKAHSGMCEKLENIEKQTKDIHSAICGEEGLFVRVKLLEKQLKIVIAVIATVIMTVIGFGDKIATAVADYI